MSTERRYPIDKNWREKFGIQTVRFPRIGVDEVEQLLKSSWPPAIELRENPEHRSTEIVIHFRHLPENLWRLHESFVWDGMTLFKAFDEVLRRRIHQKTIRAELSGIGFNALRAAWLHLLEMIYLNSSHPRTDTFLTAQIAQLRAKTTRNGRAAESQVDNARLGRRYLQLLTIAQRVHRAAETAARQYQATKPEGNKIQKIRMTIWEDVKPEIGGTRAAEFIFSGEAFARITEDSPYADPGDPWFARLEEPGDWTPDDLALALLILEEDKKPTIIRGKINSYLRKHPAREK